MKPLEELTWWQRGLLLLVIVVIITLAILLLQAESEPAAEFKPSKWDGRLIDLDKQALDEAYKGRVAHIFDVWLRDEAGQPGRATVGVQNARRAYIHAREQIEKREQH